MLAPENANHENFSAKSNAISTPVESPVTVSVDENLLALLRNEPSQRVPSETTSEVTAETRKRRETQGNTLIRSGHVAAVSAGAAFAGLGRPALVHNSEAFQPQPLGPHILSASSRSFGVIPTTRRRIFGAAHTVQANDVQANDVQANDVQANDVQANDVQTGDLQINDVQEPAPAAARRPSQLAGPAASAAIAASLAPALHLPVSHLSSSFGSTWNGVQRRKVPREASSSTTEFQTAPALAVGSQKVQLALAAPPRVESSGVEFQGFESPGFESQGLGLAPAESKLSALRAKTEVQTESLTALTLFGGQTDNLPGLVLYQAPPPNRLPLLLLFGATAATLAGLAFFFGFTPAGQAHPSAVSLAASPLQLKVESKDHSFIGIRWNPDCLPILNAEAGRLIVLESDHAPRVIDLQPSQLKIGHIYYETSFERVEFRMEVEDASGAVTKESFLALLPGRPGDQSTGTGNLSVISPGALDSPAKNIPAAKNAASSANAVSKNVVTQTVVTQMVDKPEIKPIPTKPAAGNPAPNQSPVSAVFGTGVAASMSQSPTVWQISPAPSQRGATSLALIHSRSNPK